MWTLWHKQLIEKERMIDTEAHFSCTWKVHKNLSYTKKRRPALPNPGSVLAKDTHRPLALLSPVSDALIQVSSVPPQVLPGIKDGRKEGENPI